MLYWPAYARLPDLREEGSTAAGVDSYPLKSTEPLVRLPIRELERERGKKTKEMAYYELSVLKEFRHSKRVRPVIGLHPRGGDCYIPLQTQTWSRSHHSIHRQKAPFLLLQKED